LRKPAYDVLEQHVAVIAGKSSIQLVGRFDAKGPHAPHQVLLQQLDGLERAVGLLGEHEGDVFHPLLGFGERLIAQADDERRCSHDDGGRKHDGDGHQGAHEGRTGAPRGRATASVAPVRWRVGALLGDDVAHIGARYLSKPTRSSAG
jgi:hypothetical protein